MKLYREKLGSFASRYRTLVVTGFALIWLIIFVVSVSLLVTGSLLLACVSTGLCQ